MKKLISLLVLATLCVNLLFCASAANYDFIQDSLDILAEDEIEYLNDLATEIYEDKGVGIYFDFTIAPELTEYDISALVGDQTDYYVMLENEDSWYYFSGGRGDLLDTDALREAYDLTDTYAAGIEAYLAEASLQLALSSDEPEDTESEPVEDTEEDLLVWDDAELLDGAVLQKLNGRLESISKKFNAEIRVATLPSMDDGDIDEFVHFIYDACDFGYGENHDGVLLLICMDPREYRILSNGFAADAITADDIDSIRKSIASHLTDGDYAKAMNLFADKCEYYLDGHLNGFPFDTGKFLLISLGIGLLVALIVTGIWKGQLKSVRMQNQANVYVKAGSMQITQSNDFFMYRNVTRKEKPKNNSSSSSGGSSRNIGGGSF